MPKVAIPAGTYVATMAIRLAYGRFLSPPGWSRLASLAVSNVDLYLELADRANTRRSYAASVRHFELEWRGALPATPDAIAQYLAHYAPSLTTSTLQVRLAGLSRWHRDHGFVDPTKAPLVRQVLKGVRAAHNAPRRQARPIEFDVLKHVSDWLDAEIAAAEASASPRANLLRRSRDQAMHSPERFFRVISNRLMASRDRIRARSMPQAHSARPAQAVPAGASAIHLGGCDQGAGRSEQVSSGLEVGTDSRTNPVLYRG